MQKKTSDQAVGSQPRQPRQPQQSPLPRPSRQARMHALLFGGAALGTAVLTAMGGPFKFPELAGD